MKRKTVKTLCLWMGLNVHDFEVESDGFEVQRKDDFVDLLRCVRLLLFVRLFSSIGLRDTHVKHYFYNGPCLITHTLF